MDQHECRLRRSFPLPVRDGTVEVDAAELGQVHRRSVVACDDSLMDAVGELRSLLLSRHHLIVARADDEARFMGYLRAAASGAGLPVWTWSATRGLVRDGQSAQPNTTVAA